MLEVEDYRRIADLVAADIAAGRLRPGERMPTQRMFARRHGIATSTAARVYGELVRRGLAVGEVGRGTFVREPKAHEGVVDLELNFPVLPEQAALLAPGMQRVLRHDQFTQAMRSVGVQGTPEAREATARTLARNGWVPADESLLFAGSGRQAIAAALAALVPAGGRLGVEELTYPVVKSIASQLGIELVPLEMDECGLLCDLPPVDALYVQPSLHNPLGVTMPLDRREQIAGLGVPIIEDAINSFLDDSPPPLAALAPDRVVLVDSLSKRISPGLTLGFLAVPMSLVDRVASALRCGAWAAARFPLDVATQWMSDGSAAAIVAAKRADAARRQQLVRERLVVQADPHAYHCWLPLPEQWRAETFVAAAARRGIAVTPAAAFAAVPANAPDAVRLALGSPPLDVLIRALDVLASLSGQQPGDVEG